MNRQFIAAQRRIVVSSFCVMSALMTMGGGDVRAADAKNDVIRSAKSGVWSAPETWEGGKVPSSMARVQVRTGHTVQYDVKSDETIRFLHLAGVLSFAPDKDTQLNVG